MQTVKKKKSVHFDQAVLSKESEKPEHDKKNEKKKKTKKRRLEIEYEKTEEEKKEDAKRRKKNIRDQPNTNSIEKMNSKEQSLTYQDRRNLKLSKDEIEKNFNEFALTVSEQDKYRKMKLFEYGNGEKRLELPTQVLFMVKDSLKDAYEYISFKREESDVIWQISNETNFSTRLYFLRPLLIEIEKTYSIEAIKNKYHNEHGTGGLSVEDMKLLKTIVEGPYPVGQMALFFAALNLVPSFSDRFKYGDEDGTVHPILNRPHFDYFLRSVLNRKFKELLDSPHIYYDSTLSPENQEKLKAKNVEMQIIQCHKGISMFVESTIEQYKNVVGIAGSNETPFPPLLSPPLERIESDKNRANENGIRVKRSEIEIYQDKLMKAHLFKTFIVPLIQYIETEKDIVKSHQNPFSNDNMFSQKRRTDDYLTANNNESSIVEDGQFV